MMLSAWKIGPEAATVGSSPARISRRGCAPGAISAAAAAAKHDSSISRKSLLMEGKTVACTKIARKALFFFKKFAESQKFTTFAVELKRYKRNTLYSCKRDLTNNN